MIIRDTPPAHRFSLSPEFFIRHPVEGHWVIYHAPASSQSSKLNIKYIRRKGTLLPR
jgi:hypothetical protein